MSNAMRPVWPIYRRLLGYTRRYWVFLAAALAGMLVEATAGYGFVRLMDPLVNRGFVNPEPQMAVFLPLAIVGLFVLRSLATFVVDYGMARTGRSVVRDLREEVLSKYLRLPSAYFDVEPTPVMVSRLNFDTEQVTQASADALKTIVADSLTIIYMVVLMLQMSVKVTLALLVIAPLIGVIVSFVGKRYRRISRGIQDGMGKMAQSAEQSLSAQQDVKVHGAQALETSRYAVLANRILGLNMKVETTRALTSGTVQFLAAFSLAAIVWVATREALAGHLNAGQFVTLMTSMMAIIPSLRRITSVQTQISRGVAAAERLFDILDTPEEQDHGQVAITRARGELVFDNVSLSYRSRDRDVLSDISFTARPGTVTAIVGRSGSGKTSLVRLVPRFYEP
ncbi:MAG TPA: ABC transporter transmembrane domain-containing protein, partial [Pseudoxanthomonas sp.]